MLDGLAAGNKARIANRAWLGGCFKQLLAFLDDAFDRLAGFALRALANEFDEIDILEGVGEQFVECL